MENTVKNFELMLKDQFAKKTTLIYQKNAVNQCKHKPQDVIETVNCQIKAIQLADSVKKSKTNVRSRSSFPSVSKAPVYREVPKTSKFETQCISDTQLINIIENVEAIDTHKGITQEFDNTFIQTDTSNDTTLVKTDMGHNINNQDEEEHVTEIFTPIMKEGEKDTIIDKEDDVVALEFDDNKVQLDKDSIPHQITESKYQINHKINLINSSEFISENKDTDENKLIEDGNVNNLEGNSIINNLPLNKEDVNKSIELFTENQTQFHEAFDLNRSPSPVLNLKVRRKRKRSETPPSFTVPLEVFEKFEETCLPLIDLNPETKIVINSQILGSELCLNMDDNREINKLQLSPTFDVSTDELHIDKRDLKLFENDTQNKYIVAIEPIQDESTNVDVMDLDFNNFKIEEVKNSKENKTDIFKDEILFSSDEEEYVHKELEDLPLTCALETSFYDEPGILEKTMYVGFQTASNKSIQIQTDSFERAQSMLNNRKEFSLTELVGIYDKSLKLSKDTIDQHNLNNACKVHQEKDAATSKIENKCEIKEDFIPNPHEKNEVNLFTGFRTANNTKISISDKAQAKISEVFKDIDLNDQFDNLASTIGDGKSFTNNDYVNTGISKFNTEVDAQFGEKINDDLLIQEFENIEMSLEEKELENSNKITFDGFKTASDKKIEISACALQKMKNVFQDIDLAEISDELNDKVIQDINENNRKTIVNTATTGADKISSNEQLKQKTNSTELTVNIDKNTTVNNQEPTIKNINSLIIPSTSKTFQGFKTASNKVIKISEASLSKTKNIFKDIDNFNINIKDGLSNTYKEKNNAKSYKFECFDAASEKPVKIKEVALAPSKKPFHDLDVKPTDHKFENIKPTNKAKIINDCFYNEGNNNNNPTFKGFKTASNKTVKVSEQSLAKSRKIFESIDGESCSNKTNSYSKADTDHNAVFKGFQTASNKPVKVSEHSLAKSKKLLQDIVTETCLIKSDFNGTAIKDDNDVFKGFQTASNKPVKVSEQSLAKSKKIFQDIDTEICLNKIDSYSKSIKDDNFAFKGFQTASNKPVKVSEENLAKSRQIFEKVNAETSNNTPYCKIVKDQNPVFKGFQTASNKSVDISEKALLESKKKFKEFDEKDFSENINNNIEAKKSCIGFKTANKKEVLISENALAQSKKMFEEFVDPISINSDTKVGGFTGFQTANNKNVKISKEAIEKTKNIFKDIDNYDTVTSQNITKDTLLKATQSESLKPKSNLNIFATASNKEVAVSEESLAKSKELFNNTTDTLVNIENIINTQVLDNFQDNLCTEDFRTPKPERSTSPILSCPRAKKRKFQAPYKPRKEREDTIKNIPQVKNQTYFDKDYKKNKVLKLKDLKIDKNKIVDPYISNLNINNILKFEFSKQRNDLTDENLNIDGLKSIFIGGVDEKIIPEGWLDIQIKLIIWKLLSYEVKFNFTCTAKKVLNQLKYRYDKELYRVERSALRKIFEKDDIPSKTMILCVADVYVNGESVTDVTTTDNIELLLTDGWYFIKASIDKMLSKLVYDKKIFVGCKLATNGAELLNCDQGVAPWEDTSSIRLKLSYNSTRPAHWDARLGYCQSAILSHLSTVKLEGGKICKLRVFVTRVYPLLYVEKFEDGSTVTRSERLEHLHQIKYETDREAMLEKIYEEVQKELSDQESQDSESYIETNNKRKVCDSGSQIAKMMKKSKDPMEFRAQLTTSQVQLLQDHISKHRDKMLSIIQDKMRSRLVNRNVVPLARGKIADVEVKNGKIVVTTGMLSVWKPNDAILDIFKENSWVEVMNVIPTAIRYSEIQISAGRQSVFRKSKQNVDNSLLPHLEKLKRKVYKIEELSKKSITDNEIDTVGLIFLIDPSNPDFDSTKQFQNVYLADENKNMICINFWGGIKKFGFHNVIDTGQIISCANLQRRAGNSRKNIPQYRVTEFTSITKTPKNAQSREFIEDLSKKLGTNRDKFSEDCVAIQNNYIALQCFDENSPYRFNKSDFNISKNKQFIDTPLRQNNDFNLTGLDFESTFKQVDTQLSPKTLLRKKKVNERIAKLKMYGEPPPLSPINIVNKSRNATNSYKSPLVSSNNDTRAHTNVTRGRKMVEMCNATEESTSPILNRTYIQRNVNPIKLDFSKNSSVSKDQFSEDFDASPPLSLD